MKNQTTISENIHNVKVQNEKIQKVRLQKEKVQKVKVIAFDLQGTLVDHSDPPLLFLDSKYCLEQLEQHFLLVLVTEGKVLDNVDELLSSLGIKEFFKLVLHLKGTEHHKADGSAFLEVLKRMNILAEEMIVVGDVPQSDICGAHKIGARAIRIKRGKFQSLIPTSTEEEADNEISSLKELVSLLQ